MKLAEQEDILFRGKSTETNNFKINATGKAFKILSSSLYVRKVRAVIREICTNALDGHIAKGNQDVPFDVQLPNAVTPEFIVRDYGIGMSHQMIMENYTTYFESTKDDNNDEVGGFGLGCKSPFSYTNSFQVKSFMDGVLRVYSCYMNAIGEPSIDLQLETDTDEPNGIQVSVPVQSCDFYEFRNEAAFVISSFYVKPNISVAPAYELEHIVDDVYKSNYHHRWLNNYNIRMGNVVYPLRNNDKVGEAIQNTDIINLFDGQLIFDFKVGEVPVAPSREDLEYDPWVVDYIVERINQIEQKLKDKIDKSYKELKDDLNGLQKMYDTFGFATHYIDDLEFKNPVPYTTEYTKKVYVDGHFEELVSTPLWKLDLIQQGVIANVYEEPDKDYFGEENPKPTDKTNILNCMMCYNSKGLVRKLISRRNSRITQVSLPNLYVNKDQDITVYTCKQSFRSVILNHGVTKSKSFSDFYIGGKPERIAEVKPYLDMLFGTRVRYDELLDPTEAKKFVKPPKMYRTYTFGNQYSLSNKGKMDYVSGIDDVDLSEFTFRDTNTVFYCTHTSTNPDLPENSMVDLLSGICSREDYKVLLIPKRFLPDVENYDGEYRLVNAKHLVLGVLNKYLTPLKNLTEDNTYSARTFFNRFDIKEYNSKKVSGYGTVSGTYPAYIKNYYGDIKKLRKARKRYKKVLDENYKTIVESYEQVMKDHPILEYIEEYSYYRSTREEEIKPIVKGMLNEK